MRIHIASDCAIASPEFIYILKILGINKEVTFEVVFSDDKTAPSIGNSASNTIRVSNEFINRKLSVKGLNGSGMFEVERGEPDHISTAFFYLTALQEHEDKDPDILGRFKYKNSIQHKFQNVTRNVVQECFDQIALKLNLPDNLRKSSFFLSHDIDSVYGGIMEDGFNVIKKGRIDLFIKMLFQVAMGKPDWLNIDQILNIESQYDCYSTFYWIVNKGNINRIQKNADYDFKDQRIRKLFDTVSQNHSDNGLHKSLATDSFHEEIKKFGTLPVGNRYHFLKFKLPQGFEFIEEAGLKLDASLGFSEQWGFRNNYGLPFNPYNFNKREPFDFVEVPLHIMDRTFFSKGMNINQVEKLIFEFFETHKYNCVLSVLWHNNFFTEYKYKGYLSLYKKILAYIKVENLRTMKQEEIFQNFRISWP